jgi:hypothetical protein
MKIVLYHAPAGIIGQAHGDSFDPVDPWNNCTKDFLTATGHWSPTADEAVRTCLQDVVKERGKTAKRIKQLEAQLKYQTKKLFQLQGVHTVVDDGGAGFRASLAKKSTEELRRLLAICPASGPVAAELRYRGVES